MSRAWQDNPEPQDYDEEGEPMTPEEEAELADMLAAEARHQSAFEAKLVACERNMVIIRSFAGDNPDTGVPVLGARITFPGPTTDLELYLSADGETVVTDTREAYPLPRYPLKPGEEAELSRLCAAFVRFLEAEIEGIKMQKEEPPTA